MLHVNWTVLVRELLQGLSGNGGVDGALVHWAWALGILHCELYVPVLVCALSMCEFECAISRTHRNYNRIIININILDFGIGMVECHKNRILAVPIANGMLAQKKCPDAENGEVM